GAASPRRRILHLGRLVERTRLPSMGPPPRGGGYISENCTSCVRRVLQWGRLPEEADTGEALPAGRAGAAFNGAASPRRRIPEMIFEVTASRMSLQWGRLPEEADTSRIHLAGSQRWSLQWGRLPEEADTIETYFPG